MHIIIFIFGEGTSFSAAMIAQVSAPSFKYTLCDCAREIDVTQKSAVSGRHIIYGFYEERTSFDDDKRTRGAGVQTPVSPCVAGVCVRTGTPVRAWFIVSDPPPHVRTDGRAGPAVSVSQCGHSCTHNPRCRSDHVTHSGVTDGQPRGRGGDTRASAKYTDSWMKLDK